MNTGAHQTVDVHVWVQPRVRNGSTILIKKESFTVSSPNENEQLAQPALRELIRSKYDMADEEGIEILGSDDEDENVNSPRSSDPTAGRATPGGTDSPRGSHPPTAANVAVIIRDVSTNHRK